MRWQIIFATVSLAVCLGASTPQAGKSDQDALQGVWQLVGGQKEGKDMSKDEVDRIGGYLTITADTLSFKGKEDQDSGSFKLDPTKNPKQIDLTHKIDGSVSKGIYELNGDDFKVCPGGPGPNRATDFKSNDFMVFKRVKK